MKNKKILIPFAILIITVISIYSLVTTNISDIREYNKTVETAREYASQGVVDDAVKYYQKAIEMNCNEDIYIEYVNVYVDNGYQKKALRTAEEMKKAIDHSPKVYECLLDRYLDLKSYEDCFKLDDEATKKRLRSDGFKEKMAEIEYTYTQDYSLYQAVNAFSCGFAAVKSDELYGVVDETGKRVLSKAYKEAGNFSHYTNKKNKDDSDNVIPVCTKDGKWMYISSSGNKKIEIDEEIEFDYLGLYIDNGLTAASVSGKYSYYNTNFEKQFGDYDYASSFNCGCAAVRVGKNEWYIINDKGEKINSTPYLDVVLDSKEIAFRNDRAFVNTDGNYYMIDTSCNIIGKQKFSEAKPFLDTKSNNGDANSDCVLAAVSVDGKWGYIDVDGNLVIDAQFQDAHSFSNSLAAVSMDGKWGFINKEGKVVIDYTFEDVGDFNTKGCVFTSTNSRWSLIKLYRHNH